MQQAAYSKKSPGLFFFNPAEMSLLGNLFELFFQCLGSLCTFYFIYKIVSVQNIVQMYAEQHTGAGCESNVACVASVLLLDEESDALLKINDVFIKIQKTNTLDVKTCHQSCLLFVFGQAMKAIAVHFVHERSAGRRADPWAVPAEHDSSSAWESALLRSKQNYRVVHLLVNYIGLMFNLYF